MRQLDEVINDANLTEEEFQEVRTAVIKTEYVNLSGREVLPIHKVDAGRQEYGYDTQSDVGLADVIAKSTNFPGMNTDLARTLLPIVKHGVAFKIAREDLLSSRTRGENLETRNAERASKLTQNKENTTCIQGNTTYGVNGLYTAAGNTQTGADWGANDPTDDLLNAMAKIGAQYEADTLLLNTAQYLQLFRRNTSTDKTYLEIINGMGITVIKDRDITAGTGLLFQKGADIAELVVAEDLDVERDYKLEDQSFRFNVFLRSVPAIYQSDALCTLTGI